jgi:hypothetical protein
MVWEGKRVILEIFVQCHRILGKGSNVKAIIPGKFPNEI